MFINHDIIAIAFRLINFVAIIGALFFIFEKYGKDKFLARIKQEENNRQALRTQQIVLEKQQAQLGADSKEDALACEKLKTYIDDWKKVVTLEHENQVQKHTSFLLASKKRKADIATGQEHKRVQRIVTQEIISNLEKSLALHFADTKKNSAYMTDIVLFMNRKAS